MKPQNRFRRAAGTVVGWWAGFGRLPHARRSRLKRAEDLGAILNQVFVGLVEVDLQGRIVAANQRFSALVERPLGLLVGGRFRDLLYSADVVTYERAIDALVNWHGPFIEELRVMTPDKSAVSVDVAASALPLDGKRIESVVLVIHDVAGRKRAEARAAETERRFRDVADVAPVFIWTSGTDRKRRHTWVNSRWGEFRGQPMEDELGSGWTRGVHADDLQECLAAYSAAFDHHSPFTAEYRLCRFDGEYRWVLDSGTPMHDEHGRFVGYIGSAIDISDRKAVEGEREALLEAERTARSEAERANQLKDEFLSILSHELRTPLNAVLGWVHLLQATTTPRGELSRGLAIIERNARLQGRMVDDLLDMGGVMAGKMRIERRVVPIRQVIDGAIESLHPSFIEKEISIKRLSDSDSGNVNGDPNRLHQIVWNLLSNALKFTSSGGEVVVELQHTATDVRIVVRDDGQGIDPEFLPFVFERFRQGDGSTRRSHRGLGIGLALVKSLTELHGGTVQAASRGPGLGAAFTVTLPLVGSARVMADDAAALLAHGLKDEVQAEVGERL
jgi:PAS domain S-box-containing protein